MYGQDFLQHVHVGVIDVLVVYDSTKHLPARGNDVRLLDRITQSSIFWRRTAASALILLLLFVAPSLSGW